MKTEATTDQASIVLVGAFNPKIFHPAWLAMNGLISSQHADDAEIVIVHTDITQFKAAYMAFDIRSNKFKVRCDAIYKEVVKDLVLAAFGEHLPHSLVWQLGINRSISFSCGSEEVRNKFGDLLAPKEPWGEWGKEIAQFSIGNAKHGGMVRLTMLQQPRPDGLDGHIQADLQPAPDDLSVVVVDINNHFNVGDPEKVIGCLDAMDIIRRRWLDAMEKAEYIVDCLMVTIEDLT